MGNGTWWFPGGKLEFKEKVTDCAYREVRDETGLNINILKKGPYIEHLFEKENQHFITLFMIAKYVSGELKKNLTDAQDGVGLN